MWYSLELKWRVKAQKLPTDSQIVLLEVTRYIILSCCFKLITLWRAFSLILGNHHMTRVLENAERRERNSYGFVKDGDEEGLGWMNMSSMDRLKPCRRRENKLFQTILRVGILYYTVCRVGCKKKKKKLRIVYDNIFQFIRSNRRAV